jgi:hypothetical protein
MPCHLACLKTPNAEILYHCFLCSGPSWRLTCYDGGSATSTDEDFNFTDDEDTGDEDFDSTDNEDTEDESMMLDETPTDMALESVDWSMPAESPVDESLLESPAESPDTEPIEEEFAPSPTMDEYIPAETSMTTASVPPPVAAQTSESTGDPITVTAYSNADCKYV